MNKFREFLALLSLVHVGVAQLGEKCSTTLAQLYPRQNFYPHKLAGEWYGIGITYKYPWQNEGQWEGKSCMSQIYTRQQDETSKNMDVVMKLNFNGKNLALNGIANISADQPAHWKKHFFNNPSAIWEENVIATDYHSYWIHYECRVTNGTLVEGIVIRARTRTISPTEREIFESITEGLGYPKENYVAGKQPASCDGEPKPVSRPTWFNDFN